MECGKMRASVAALFVGIGLTLSSCVVYDPVPYYVERGEGRWHKPHKGWHDNGLHRGHEGRRGHHDGGRH